MQQGNLLVAIIWMAVISLLLFWLPLLGPLLAGFVGGRTAGSAGRGLLAAVLPAAVLCFVLVGFGTALAGLPIIGALAGLISQGSCHLIISEDNHVQISRRA